ncbi:hypothetical protein N7507_010386 [Penicillium longicatenatum]|nr:hypothetical protein N7507_010386 [Penicillium longicatenatum]
MASRWACSGSGRTAGYRPASWGRDRSRFGHDPSRFVAAHIATPQLISDGSISSTCPIDLSTCRLILSQFTDCSFWLMWLRTDPRTPSGRPGQIRTVQIASVPSLFRALRDGLKGARGGGRLRIQGTQRFTSIKLASFAQLCDYTGQIRWSFGDTVGDSMGSRYF